MNPKVSISWPGNSKAIVLCIDHHLVDKFGFFLLNFGQQRQFQLRIGNVDMKECTFFFRMIGEGFLLLGGYLLQDTTVSIPSWYAAQHYEKVLSVEGVWTKRLNKQKQWQESKSQELNCDMILLVDCGAKIKKDGLDCVLVQSSGDSWWWCWLGDEWQPPQARSLSTKQRLDFQR
jgi:hypothetical protein